MKSGPKIKVLLIEDEEFDVRRIFKTIRPFSKRIFIQDVVSNGNVAVKMLQDQTKRYDVVIMDYQIAGGIMGENLIRQIKRINPTLQIIVVTKMTINMTDFDFANSLIEAGATWYCTKYPGDIDDYIYQPTDFILSIFNAYEKKKLQEDKLNSTKKLDQKVFDILAQKQIIGNSPDIHLLRKQIEQNAEADTNVIISGLSGTGKELVAANIHYTGKRKFENFVPINCGSLPENLIESELFGFEKGSFTGAVSKKQGLFEIADKGTIFLDEITELPLSAQSTLLRVIQEGEIDKIGRTKKVKVNVRILAATNKNLSHQVREKRFREDLYYRLNVMSIFVPPLSQRRDDIPLLIDHFLNLFGNDMNRDIPGITDRAMEYLVNYNWQGNVRELQNIVQRLLIIGEKTLDKNHVKTVLGIQPEFESDTLQWQTNFPGQDQIIHLQEMEQNFRYEYFKYVRTHTTSDAEAARKLGLAPPNYHRMCKKMGLK